MDTVLCLGPTGAGKTLLIKKLKGRDTQKTGGYKEFTVRELGGSMAPMWSKYYDNVKKIIYVVDTSNLCQISAAGVLLYSILTEPRLQKAKVLIVLTKMDVSYRQMRNEALLMLQMKRLQAEVNQVITVLEASAVTGEGMENIAKWLQDALPKKSTILPK